MQIIAGSFSERSAQKKIICDFLPIILYMYSATSAELEASPLNIWPFQLLIQTQVHCNVSAPCSSRPPRPCRAGQGTADVPLALSAKSTLELAGGKGKI